MKKRAKKIASLAKWLIAIVGVWVVVSRMSLRDSVLLLNPTTNLPTRTQLVEDAEEISPTFRVIDPATKQAITVDRARIINPIAADDKPKKIQIQIDGKEQAADLLGMRLEGDLTQTPQPQQLLVQPQGSPTGQWIFPTEVVGGYQLDVPRPRIDVGIITMVYRANPWLLLLAVLIFPVTYLLTSYRWHRLLEEVDIQIGLARAFVINMVGAFYNTFMPGSVGGDVFKMYYVARQTPHRTQAVVSVIIDRVIGLLALVMIGGVMAAYQYATAANRNDPTARACFQVALASVGILSAVAVGMAVFFQPAVRRMLGLEFILERLPMQKQIEKIRGVTRIYRRKPVFMLAMLIITFPVHITVIFSAMLAGQALDLPIKPLFYFTAVPVIVLVGSIPISPQGAGVMEVFAYLLMRQQSATVSQAVALTMSIRLVQIFWNLSGGIFVIRGGYHAPTESEQRELEEAGDIETRGQGDKGTGGEGDTEKR